MKLAKEAFLKYEEAVDSYMNGVVANLPNMQQLKDNVGDARNQAVSALAAYLQDNNDNTLKKLQDSAHKVQIEVNAYIDAVIKAVNAQQ